MAAALLAVPAAGLVIGCEDRSATSVAHAENIRERPSPAPIRPPSAPVLRRPPYRPSAEDASAARSRVERFLESLRKSVEDYYPTLGEFRERDSTIVDQRFDEVSRLFTRTRRAGSTTARWRKVLKFYARRYGRLEGKPRLEVSGLPGYEATVRVRAVARAVVYEQSPHGTMQRRTVRLVMNFDTLDAIRGTAIHRLVVSRGATDDDLKTLLEVDAGGVRLTDYFGGRVLRLYHDKDAWGTGIYTSDGKPLEMLAPGEKSASPPADEEPGKDHSPRAPRSEEF